jgi:uncharacterized protein
MSSPGRTALAIAMLAASMFLQARTAMAADDKAVERTVTVSATGSVTAEPDVAYVSVGVIVDGDTAKDALARNGTVMTKVLEGLKGQGISSRDIQTTGVNVEPRYAQGKDGLPAAVVGYRVVNQVRLAVREVARLGEILDAAVALGANQVHSISFDVASGEALRDEARKQAVANARRRAELYAAAAGVRLGNVLQISENAGDVGRPVFAARAAASAVPIEAGTRVLTVEVTVVYALQ